MTIFIPLLAAVAGVAGGGSPIPARAVKLTLSKMLPHSVQIGLCPTG